MASKNRPSRRTYLNDFKRDASGRYIYRGRYLAFDGAEKRRKRLLAKLCVLAFVSVLAVIGAGSLDTAGMDNTFYVLIPYMGEIAFTAALVWATVRLCISGEPLREYIYKATVDRLPKLGFALAISAAVTLICAGIYLTLNGFGGKAVLCVTYLLLQIVIIFVSFLHIKALKKARWNSEK
ncbi:MAG: hypothetical protein IJ766_06145 [Clostridia bacterium]|nr:hypothetical protein [Clostridia bacterium]